MIMSVRVTLIGTMFLGSMGMDFLFNPEVGLTQSHFYRNGGKSFTQTGKNIFSIIKLGSVPPTGHRVTIIDLVINLMPKI